MSTRHDLDHASTTPLRPAARDAVVDALGRTWGDPSRVHRDGMEARAALEEARERVASFLGARPREVVFTSGASESIAFAAAGAADRGGNQVATSVEHSAVRLSAERHGDVRLAAVDRHGLVDVDALLDAVDDGTGAVHVQWGNHEVGTIQPVAEVVSACRDRGVLVHVDAAQAAGRLPIDFSDLGADLLSVSGHKLGGPAGTGVLLIRRGVRLRPLIAGGDQELARRAGLENVAGALGLAAAMEAIDVAGEAAEQRRLRDRLDGLVDDLEGFERYGPGAGGDGRDARLPHIVCAGIGDIEPQAVLFGLDRRGISAHSGSACASADLEPSPVLAAMGVDAHRSLRLSVGWSSTDADVDAIGAALPAVIAELRALRPTH